MLLNVAIPFLQHGHGSGNYMSSQKMPHKKNVKSKEYDDYSHYSDENFGNYNEEEKDEDFADQLKQYRQAKETSSTDLGPPFPKEPVKKQGMKGIQKGERIRIVHCSHGWGQQLCRASFRGVCPELSAVLPTSLQSPVSK